MGLIWKVIRKAEREKSEGILIAPDWPGSSFCSLVEEREMDRTIEFLEGFSAELTCPEDIVSNMFRGVPEFLINVYGFCFKTMNDDYDKRENIREIIILFFIQCLS